MKITSKVSANTLKCDVVGCSARFHSYSMHSILRKQAKNEGWQRTSRAKVMKAFGLSADALTGGQVGRRLFGTRAADEARGEE